MTSLEFEFMPFANHDEFVALAPDPDGLRRQASRIAAGSRFEQESPSYPGISCVRPGNPYLLHCFPPFKSELTRQQHDHLDIIAEKIRRSFSTTKPITKVVIVGHSSTWHKTSRSQLELRAIQRAGNAGEQLILRLDRMGLAKRVDIETDGRSDTERWRGKTYSSTSGSQQARNDRALNRRVEIRLVSTSRTPARKCANEDLGLAARLEKMSTAGLHQDRAVRAQIDCLRGLLVDALRCRRTVDDVYLHTPFAITAGPPSKIGPIKPFEKRRLVADLKAHVRVRCKGKTGTAFANCFKEIFDDVERGILFAWNEAKKYQTLTKLPPSMLSKTPYCTYPCWMMNKARRSNSVYSCFRKLIGRIFPPLCSSCPSSL